MSVPGFVGRPAYRLYQWAWAGLDWLYPPQCGGCGTNGTRWCQACQQKTQQILPPICQHCGQSQTAPGVCPECRTSAPHYTALRSWAIFEGSLRNALHRLKYRGDMALAEILARPLIELLHDLKWLVDFLTPVPAGLARQAERGYNQAALIALPLALGSGITYRPKALVKVRETRTQVGLTISQRRKNVAQAFQARTALVADRRVLVVDDITTSGATLDACAMALLNAGATEVYGLTLARARLPVGAQSQTRNAYQKIETKAK